MFLPRFCKIYGRLIFQEQEYIKIQETSLQPDISLIHFEIKILPMLCVSD